MNQPLSIQPGHLSLSRWSPPSDPVRFFALLGCLEPHGIIRKHLSNDGLWWLQKMATKLWDEAQGGEPLNADFMRQATQQISNDLHKQMPRGFHWTLPQLEGTRLRHPLGLDVPAVWGVYGEVNYCRARLKDIESGACIRFRNEKLAMRNVIGRSERLLSIITPSVQGHSWSVGSGVILTDRRSTMEWERFAHVVRVAGHYSVSFLIERGGEPPLQSIARRSRGKPHSRLAVHRSVGNDAA
jgi:hypothetical protein